MRAKPIEQGRFRSISDPVAIGDSVDLVFDLSRVTMGEDRKMTDEAPRNVVYLDTDSGPIAIDEDTGEIIDADAEHDVTFAHSGREYRTGARAGRTTYHATRQRIEEALGLEIIDGDEAGMLFAEAVKDFDSYVIAQMGKAGRLSERQVNFLLNATTGDPFAVTSKMRKVHTARRQQASDA
jgi:hypothetical protein